MKGMSEDRDGYRVALMALALYALSFSVFTVERAEAQRPPANKTYFAVLLATGSENYFAAEGKCLTFTETETCTITGECGNWFPTETAGAELAFVLDMSYETHGSQARIEGQGRIDTRGSRHTMAVAGRYLFAGTAVNIGFVARPVAPQRCPVILEEFIHKAQANPACIERAAFGDPADSPYVLPYPAGNAYLVDSTYCNGFNHSLGFSYDFRMPVGSALVAVRAGVVRAVRSDLPDNAQVNDPQTDSSGNYVEIEHDDGMVSNYAHLSQHNVFVQPGERVAAGQLIGLSGYSGNAHAPHLHFTVFSPTPSGFLDSVPVNFRNCNGRLDPRGGLMKGVVYEALP